MTAIFQAAQERATTGAMRRAGVSTKKPTKVAPVNAPICTAKQIESPPTKKIESPTKQIESPTKKSAESPKKKKKSLMAAFIASYLKGAEMRATTGARRRRR
ncbi:expressed unknown protein [Seminavis robusta]|uniref:Uncharacterized protein n=1 Tax=Seminavis robusta TaxID=568900 RepID=A0A9N8ES54_9STRA|nr:expressed unknown protein [Seminavis robusta]|eukprot:Sro1626_g286850.1 n/a (102) ;mRNA; r:7385-7690